MNKTAIIQLCSGQVATVENVESDSLEFVEIPNQHGNTAVILVLTVISGEKVKFLTHNVLNWTLKEAGN